MKQPLPITSSRIGIFYAEPSQKKRAAQLARSLSLPLITDTTGYDFILGYSHHRLNLSTPNDSKQTGRVYAEFVQGAAGHRRKQGRREMLLRAIGFHKDKPLIVLDATGGLGRDSFLMAGYGCEIYTLERNLIVASLLEDGLRRALEHPDTVDIAKRIQLTAMDALQFIGDAANSQVRYDIIYLDPMYPRRSKRALVKKEMQLLQKLIGHEDDAELLFTRALATARQRVVVKRPKSAAHLAGSTPSHSVSGKTTRFDVYMIKQPVS